MVRATMVTVRQQLHRMIDDALDDDPRRALIAARQLQEEVVWLLQRAVALARRQEWSWGRIGRLIGTTRQAAQQRFGSVVPRVPPHRRADRQDPMVQHLRETERMLREMQSGQWQRHHGDHGDHGDDGDDGGGEAVPW